VGKPQKISLSAATFSALGSTSNTLVYGLYYSDESGTVATNDSGATSTSFSFGNLSTPIEITGNRLITIRVKSGTPVTGDTYSAAVSALGNVTYSVNEVDYGDFANPGTNTNMSDTISGLYVDGKPVLGTVRYSAS
jgi:hypothetical protein